MIHKGERDAYVGDISLNPACVIHFLLHSFLPVISCLLSNHPYH